MGGRQRHAVVQESHDRGDAAECIKAAAADDVRKCIRRNRAVVARLVDVGVDAVLARHGDIDPVRICRIRHQPVIGDLSGRHAITQADAEPQRCGSLNFMNS